MVEFAEHQFVGVAARALQLLLLFRKNHAFAAMAAFVAIFR